MTKLLYLRAGLVAGAVGVFVCAAACSSSPNQPSNVAAPAPAGPQTLTLLVKVSNTHFGNAIPSDFKLTVSYDGAAASASTVDGASEKVEVSIPRNVNYKVTVAQPDGYAMTLSAGCSGTSVAETATCEVAAADVDVTCDKTLWDPVYTKDRLKILSSCRVATGVVRGIEIERDGDLELWLTPDTKHADLMRPGNDYSKGWFVVEIPCQAPIVQVDAIGTCDKFAGPKMQVPAVGDHVVVAAPWVEDKTHHNWGELHGARVIKLPR